METATPEALYAGIRKHYRESDRLPEADVRAFSNRIKMEFTRMAAFSTRKSLQPDAIRAVDRIIGTAEKRDMFPVRLEGAEQLRDCDLILGNHQGPSGAGKRQGGLETIFSWKMLPMGVRFVMKDELLKLSWNIKNLIRALVFRRMDPIAVHRPEKKEVASERERAKLLLEERRRVFRQVFDTIDGETGEPAPVFLYPEGTRSSDGSILPFMRDLFDTALDGYVLPRMQRSEEPKIGLLVADTLQVVPEGCGGDAPMYRRPLTMRGVRYDPTGLATRLKGCETPLQKRQLGKWFCEDVRSHMQRELADILS
ncbi:MAG: 1-acyl-sn-glycerol-3-phosphate acyltransferase [Candidatus Peribacteraceae bacterium]|nr:1-acyl-sn-glycerol-3-phosphate acyltransferase [Candidatus Peribacteraceae bacterium]MDD5074999.1 1-acyl-sn-glycerol-3-phosphate acyltransferase [Candidatus Peribacteraceae bacterium]